MEVTVKDCKSKTSEELTKREVVRTRRVVTIFHTDIIGEDFWTDHPEILGVTCS